jgi:hypothetical protein
MKLIARDALVAILILFALMAIAFAQPVNPDVTPETIRATICVSGWTKTVRPPVSYTNAIKKKLMEDAGIEWSHASELELDHRLPIEDGGSPTDPANLWLQTWAPESPWPGIESGAHLKDAVETRLKRLICTGHIELREAQACIWNDWRACAQQLKGLK